MENVMNANKTTKKSLFFWGILFVTGLLCIWKTQRAVPVMMDDEWYSTVLSSDAPLTSLRDIVQAQLWHYLNWGGRTVAYTIAQLIFLTLNEPLADALNTGMILLLAWMLNAIMCIRKEHIFPFTTLTMGFLHGLNANWKMSMYWQTGACNYLYTTVLILAFLWIYLRALQTRDDMTRGQMLPTRLLQAVAVFILGLLCGWTNENMGPAVWVLTLAIIFLQKRAKAPVPLWMIPGNAGCLIGSALMILAPGNGVRSAEVTSSNYGTLWQVFLRMYGVCKGAWDYLFPVILVTALALFINLCLLKGTLHVRERILLSGALLSWGAMLLSPHYPDRAAFGTLCFLLCILLSQTQSILLTLNDKRHRLFLAGIGVFIWLRGMYVLGEFLAISWGWIR